MIGDAARLAKMKPPIYGQPLSMYGFSSLQ